MNDEKYLSKDISIIVCARNEQVKIRRCLEPLVDQGAGEIIVIDGHSEDATVDIASSFDVKVILGQGAGLTRDRQLGINSSSGKYIFFVDADHILKSGQIIELIKELNFKKYDAIQAGLEIVSNSFLCRGESDLLKLTHNIPGEKKMIGVAPTLYKRELFEKIQFDSHITSTIDDTDFFYRLSRDTNYVVGVGSIVVSQDHNCSLNSYLLKFWWYGKGDGEFCVKHRNRALSMVYHLLIRYPIVYPIRSLKLMRINCAVFSVIQGFVRATSATYRFFQLMLSK